MTSLADVLARQTRGSGAGNMARPFIAGIGGTTRTGSSGERMARAVLEACQDRGAETNMFAGPDLEALPHYRPENPFRTAEQRSFVDTVRRANGLVIASPGYHGGISGLVKNAIDLLEDLNGGERPYLEGRAVGLVVVAAGWQACGTTLSAMRDIVHALRGWPTPVGITVNPLAKVLFGPNGRMVDPDLRALVDTQAAQIMDMAERDLHVSGRRSTYELDFAREI